MEKEKFINLQLFADEEQEQTDEKDEDIDDAIASTIADLQSKLDNANARADKAEKQVIQLTKVMRNQEVNYKKDDEKKEPTANELVNQIFGKR